MDWDIMVYCWVRLVHCTLSPCRINQPTRWPCRDTPEQTRSSIIWATSTSLSHVVPSHALSPALPGCLLLLGLLSTWTLWLCQLILQVSAQCHFLQVRPSLTLRLSQVSLLELLSCSSILPLVSTLIWIYKCKRKKWSSKNLVSIWVHLYKYCLSNVLWS